MNVASNYSIYPQIKLFFLYDVHVLNVLEEFVYMNISEVPLNDARPVTGGPSILNICELL